MYEEVFDSWHLQDGDLFATTAAPLSVGLMILRLIVHKCSGATLEDGRLEHERGVEKSRKSMLHWQLTMHKSREDNWHPGGHKGRGVLVDIRRLS